ncbi:Zn-ribbon domain-containing OB-fold protein [Blastococcus sp. TF02A-26]|uniref:Zn-ribbon domain-containing OB-fold protein n=1 Tax=Blastococcus sp. TF02A-26 TaxID=2250577 RepID=UPI000DE924C8|nr:OB-fold domain-containing protein [Blastococcus sp. TF02A-26]RBY84387.1 hypothetical protein DQ240_14820 [Blastococcus sp. TF02A-26]
MTRLQPQSGPLPHAEPTGASAPFWAGCASGELRYQRCRACAAVTSPPVETCRECLSADLAWEVSAGTGTVYSWTVVHRPATAAFAAVPYAPAIVDVAEGFQLLTNLVDVAPEDITAGMPVAVRFVATADGPTLPYFAPAPASPEETLP